MLNRTARLAAAIAIAMLSLPAAAGTDGFTYIGGDAGWEPSQHKYVQGAAGVVHSDECDHAVRPANTAPLSKGGGFEFIGGDAGWQPTQHKFVRTAAGLVHSNECDHAIRSVRAPTAAEVDANLRLYGGA
jgi:hypothetical protein